MSVIRVKRKVENSSYVIQVEILEKELVESGARVAELEADAATVQVRRVLQ